MWCVVLCVDKLKATAVLAPRGAYFSVLTESKTKLAKHVMAIHVALKYRARVGSTDERSGRHIL